MACLLIGDGQKNYLTTVKEPTCKPLKYRRDSIVLI